MLDDKTSEAIFPLLHCLHLPLSKVDLDVCWEELVHFLGKLMYEALGQRWGVEAGGSDTTSSNGLLSLLGRFDTSVDQGAACR